MVRKSELEITKSRELKFTVSVEPGFGKFIYIDVFDPRFEFEN